MNIYIYIIMCIAVFLSTTARAQVRSGYFIDNYATSHEINPALQPDSNYMTIPVLGGTQISTYSSIGMGDVLFEKTDGKLTTFMSKGTIDKGELMDKVGNGVNLNASLRLNLFSMGRRISDNTYRTLGITLKADGAGFLSKGLFDCMKDIENRNYNIDDTGIKASAYLEFAAGESRKLNEKITVGAKAKLLVGLMNVNMNVDHMTLNTNSDTEWTASGYATLNMSGMNYKTQKKSYDSHPGSYEKVKDVRIGKPGLHGMGLAMDGGVTFRPNKQWELSAAITDFGFITWFNSHKAENNGETFRFDGFQDVEIEKNKENSLKKQWDNLHDDLMDLVHLKYHGKSTYTNMLGATINLGALYRIDTNNNYKAGALITGRIDGKYSWWETRINAMAKPFAKTNIEFCISPNYSTFGAGVGAMINYITNSGLNLYLASDRLFTTVNPQMIPTSLNGAVQIGAAIRIK
ncbi:MAG: hypothetical protein J1E57_02105 [Prevotella sp.]|nr:hypothetical protein [Prevotella sp.]